MHPATDCFMCKRAVTVCVWTCRNRVATYHDLIDQCLRAEETSVQDAAVQTLGTFASAYLASDDPAAGPALVQRYAQVGGVFAWQPAALMQQAAPTTTNGFGGHALLRRYLGLLTGTHDGRAICAIPAALAVLPTAMLTSQASAVLATLTSVVHSTVRWR